MLFSKIKIYSFKNEFNIDENALNNALENEQFKGLDRTQISTSGFVNPLSKRTDHFVHGVGDAFVVTLRADEKPIATSIINKKVKIRIKELEKRKLDKATKDEKEQIKDTVTAELVANFNPDYIKSSFISAMIIPSLNAVIINETSEKKCQLILSSIRKAIGTFPVLDFQTESLPSAVMTSWITNSDCPEEIQLLGNVKLVSDDESTAISFKNIDLESEEFTAHLDSGMVVLQINVVWNDSLTMAIDAELNISGISYTDILKEQMKENSDDGHSSTKFDSDLYMTLDNVKMLIPNLANIFS